MVAYPNENKLVYGIVVGGNSEDPDPTQSGGVRIYIPSEYGKDVNIKHLPFSRLLGQGTQEGVTRFNPPPEHGAAVMCMKIGGHSGTGHLHVLGTVSNDINRESTIPGNSDLFGIIAKEAKEQMYAKTKIRIPPNIGSGAAGSKPPKEKGDRWSHDLVKGMPSTSTLWPLNGIPIPQMTNVTTATQPFANILTGNMLSMLPGMNMTLGSLFNNLAGNLINQIFSKLSPELSMAMSSMTNLMQSMEIVEAGGFNTATKINPDVYFQNAVNLLSDVGNIYDMVSAFQRLQYDTSLFGLDKLAPVSLNFDSPFGTIPMQLDAFGNLTSLLPDGVQMLINSFSSMMQNGSMFPGVFPGQNMFGGSAAVLNEMSKRLPGGELTKFKNQMEKNVAPGIKPRDAQNKIAKMAATGVTLGLSTLKSL